MPAPRTDAAPADAPAAAASSSQTVADAALVEAPPAHAPLAEAPLDEAPVAEPPTAADVAAELAPIDTPLAPAPLAEPPAAEPTPLVDRPVAADEPPSDLPGPDSRRRTGLLRGGGANPWQAAAAGGASVTETEHADNPLTADEQLDDDEVAAAAAADLTSEELATDGSAGDRDDADASAGADAEPTGHDVVAAVDEDGDHDIPAPIEPDAPAARRPLDVEGLAGVLRLPLEPPPTLWSIEGALELLTKGLGYRLDAASGAPGDGLFAPQQDAPSGVLIALTGAHGVGKTTIALSHALRQRANLDVLWWMRGGSEAMLRADLRALAVAVGVDGTSVSELIEGLRTWLETTDNRWLLVVDGLAADVALDGLLPNGGRGHVVITAPEAPAGVDAVSISSPSPAAARRALFERFTAAGRQLEPFDDEALDRLAEALAGQPWALALAAAQLAERGVPAGRLAAQLSRPPHVELLPAAVPSGPADALLLVVLEGLAEASQSVAEAMLATTALAAAPLLQLDLDWLAGSRADVTAVAGAHGLLVLGPEQAQPVPAIVDALRSLIDRDGARRAASAAVRTVDLSLPNVASATTSDLYAPHAGAAADAAGRAAIFDQTVTRLDRDAADWRRRMLAAAGPALVPAPLADATAAPAPPAAPDTTELAAVPAAPTVPAAATAPSSPEPAETTIEELAASNGIKGSVDAASNGFNGGALPPVPPPPAAPTDAGAMAAVAPGPVPPAPLPPAADTTLADAPELVDLRRRSLSAAERGLFHDAIRLLEELVQRAESTYGNDDLRSLSARNDLANALIAAGSQHRAHQLLSRVLADTVRVYGDAHPATLLARPNLAHSHADLGRHDDALLLREQVLAARAAMFGNEHVQTVSARSNLANSYAAVGRTDEALSLRELVADVRLRTLGLDSPQTMGALNNLANSYADVGRHADALRVREQVLEGRERVLGAEHPHTITARNNLANSLAAVGRFDDARETRARTLHDCERVLGPDHPHTITARANLAFSVPEAAMAAVGNRYGAASYGTPSNGWYGTPPANDPTPLQSMEVDIDVLQPPAPPAAPQYGVPAAYQVPQADQRVGAAAAPDKRKRRFWFFGKR